MRGGARSPAILAFPPRPHRWYLRPAMGRVSGHLRATRARLALAALLLATTTFPGRASAQPVDDATRGAARTMGQEGIDAYDAGPPDAPTRKASKSECHEGTPAGARSRGAGAHTQY